MFQHLQMWLEVIRMQPKPDMCLVSDIVAAVLLGDDSIGVWPLVWCRLWLRHPINFTLMLDLLHTLLSVFGTYYCGQWSWGCNPNLIMCGLTHSGGSRRFTRFLTCMMLHVMIGAPHPLHTHSRSSSCIDNLFQHLPLWPVVIRMRPQPDRRIYPWKKAILMVYDLSTS